MIVKAKTITSKVILWPLALLYRAATGFRNHLYNIQYKKSLSFTPFIIDVGNLRVGGTGKSPMIEYLAHWLSADYPLAILSRGYLRKTRGFRLAGDEDSAETLGDEPFQFYRKFAGQQQVVVAVGEERVAAVPEILFHHPEVKLLLLDDAFQHRAIAANIHILLTAYHKPFYKDFILPVGRLREGRHGARRADVVVVTKCPEGLPEEEKQAVRANIQRYTEKDVPVFFAGIRYQEPVAVFDSNRPFTGKVMLFSGLADRAVLEQYVRRRYEVVQTISFGDHHRYTHSDVIKIQTQWETAGQEAVVLTTEKDMVKLIHTPLTEQWKKLPLFYLPIQTYLLDEEDRFKNIILQRFRC